MKDFALQYLSLRRVCNESAMNRFSVLCTAALFAEAPISRKEDYPCSVLFRRMLLEIVHASPSIWS